MRRCILLLSLCSVSLSWAAAQSANDGNPAQPVPALSSSVNHPEVTVGEPVVVRVKVLVPTWFTKPVYFDEVEALNVISVSVDKSSYPTSERVGASTWSGVIKEYMLIPMTGGNYQLDLPTLTLHYLGSDQKKLTLQVTPDPVSFNAVVPAAAASLKPLIIAQDLTLSQEMNIDQPVVVGQSFNRQVTATITGTSALFVPPLLQQANSDSLQSYLQSPQVSDQYDSAKGQVSGTRVDTQELVVADAGQVVLPDIAIRYYDLSSATVRTVSVKGQSFVVVASPSRFAWLWPLLVALVVLLVLLGIAWLLWPKWQLYRRSEPVKFRQLLSLSHTPSRVLLTELEHWRCFWRSAYQSSPEARNEYRDVVLEVEAAIYLAQPIGTHLDRRLRQHRKMLQQILANRQQRLMPLNP
jgi:hypothetical protein